MKEEGVRIQERQIQKEGPGHAKAQSSPYSANFNCWYLPVCEEGGELLRQAKFKKLLLSLSRVDKEQVPCSHSHTILSISLQPGPLKLQNQHIPNMSAPPPMLYPLHGVSSHQLSTPTHTNTWQLGLHGPSLRSADSY